MCLYPKLIRNKKYLPTKKNNYLQRKKENYYLLTKQTKELSMYQEQECIEMMKNTICNSLKKEEKKKPCSMETILIVTGKQTITKGAE